MRGVNGGALLLLMLSMHWACTAAARATDEAAGGAACADLPLQFAAVALHGEEIATVTIRQGPAEICVPAEVLQRMRIALAPVLGVAESDIDPQTWIGLSSIPDVSYRFDSARQTVYIQAQPAALVAGVYQATTVRAGELEERGSGAYLNYELNGFHFEGHEQVDATTRLGVLTPAGTLESSHVFRSLTRSARHTRLDTRWRLDLPDRLASLVVGDSISGTGNLGLPLRFAGVHLATDFSVRPDFVSYPLPLVTGEAALPSIVDLYSGGALRYRLEVPAGPFTLVDPPLVGGAGELQVVVRDMFGREQRLTQSFYVDSQLLRAGVSDYSYHLGTLRTDFGVGSGEYERLTVGGVHRYGLSSQTTLSAAASWIDEGGGLLEAGVLRRLGRFGVASVSLAHSADSPAGPEGGARLSGEALEIGYSNRRQRFSLSARSRLASSDFLAPGEPVRLRIRESHQARVSMEAGRLGTVGIGWVKRRRPELDQEFATLVLTSRFSRRLLLNLSATAGISAIDDQVRAGLTIPLGRSAQRERIRVEAEVRDDQNVVRATVDRSAPVGEGFGYQVSTIGGDRSGATATGTWQSRFFTLTGRAQELEGQEAFSLNARGSVALLGGSAFATRFLSDSFGVVEAGPLSGVRVYHQNQPVGRTGRRGKLLLPSLVPFLDNAVRLELRDIPLDVRIDRLEEITVPHRGYGTRIRFAVDSELAITVRLVDVDGEPLPMGTRAWLVEAESAADAQQRVQATDLSEPTLVALRGEVYLVSVDRAANWIVTRGPTEDQGESVSCAAPVELREVEAEAVIGPLTCGGGR